MRAKHLAKPERTVVQCEATGRAVIAVEVALAVAHANPIRHQRGQAAAKRAREQENFVGSTEVFVDDVTVFAID